MERIAEGVEATGISGEGMVKAEGGRGLFSPRVPRFWPGEAKGPDKVVQALVVLLLGLFASQVPRAAHAVSICDRTEQVREAILARVNDTETSCGNVTTGQLAGISTLGLSSEGIETLQAGDFSGLPSLTTLYLHRNSLTSLPSGVFSGLSSLTTLYLHSNGLTGLPSGVFSGLSSLTTLDLGINSLIKSAI